MLEERLSKAYSQHSIGGYNLPPPRQASGPSPYPSLQANAPNPGGPAESFYTGEQHQEYAQAPPHSSYAHTHAHPPQPSPQSYAAYDKQASLGTPNNQYPQQQVPQRTGSWAGQQPPQAQQYPQQPSYPPNEATSSQAPLAPPAANDSVGTTPTNDPNASFYFSNQQQQQQSQQAQQPSAPGQDPTMSPYPNLSQSGHSYQPSLPQTPASVPAQPSQPQQQHQAPTQQSQQPYWQHSAAQQTPLPPVWQAAPPSAAYTGYSQEAFPSAPQHAPAKQPQPVMEESLIDL